MARKRSTKGKVQHNKRVRFCSLDYYRYICTGMTSTITGIDNYSCENEIVMVWYTNGLQKIYWVNEGEKQLKQVIKIINAYLGGTGDGTQQQ